MFFAHIPAGYLVSRALTGKRLPAPVKGVIIAGMMGGTFPDIDLLYLHLLDATPQHHHTYWTHLPIAWIGIASLTWVVTRRFNAPCRLAIASFLLAWLSHLLLDTVAGDMWWLYPLIDQPYSLVHIEAIHHPWWMNYLLHWSMALELSIIGLAVALEARQPVLLRGIKMARFIAIGTVGLVSLIAVESLVPNPILQQQVFGARSQDWNANTYWHPNWGKSGVHKGIDIFAARGTPVVAAQAGLVVYQGLLREGGNVVAVLSPRGWLHYYAHLDQAFVPAGTWVTANQPLGSVGQSGNAQGKAAHLHYAIVSPVPRLQSFRPVSQGWKRVFYRNPDALLKRAYKQI